MIPRDVLGGALRGLSRYGLLAVLLGELALFVALRPESFGTWGSFRGILSTEVTTLFLAFAATLPLIVGRFDLSIAAIFTFSQVLLVGLVVQHRWAVAPAILVTFAAAGLVGLLNGLVVARLRIDSFIATLASGSIVGGATLAYSNGESVYGTAPAALTSIARSSIAGVPLTLVYAVVVAALLTVLLSRFPVGRRMYAIGFNERAAARTGIATQRHVIATFIVSAMLAATGGMLLGARLGAASTDTGAQLLIVAFAGAFLGAAAITPGRFNIPGTVIAVYVLAVAVTGMQHLEVAVWVEPVFEGVVLLLAVGLCVAMERLHGRRARASRLRQLERRTRPATSVGA